MRYHPTDLERAPPIIDALIDSYSRANGAVDKSAITTLVDLLSGEGHLSRAMQFILPELQHVHMYELNSTLVKKTRHQVMHESLLQGVKVHVTECDVRQILKSPKLKNKLDENVDNTLVVCNPDYGIQKENVELVFGIISFAVHRQVPLIISFGVKLMEILYRECDKRKIAYPLHRA